jgi:hypothetical protein
MTTADDKKHAEAEKEAAQAAQLAHSNIRRFLDLQAQRAAALIMKAHEADLNDSAKAAQAASELAAINIQRFLNLQAERLGSLIMRAHQMAETEKPKTKT